MLKKNLQDLDRLATENVYLMIPTYEEGVLEITVPIKSKQARRLEIQG